MRHYEQAPRTEGAKTVVMHISGLKQPDTLGGRTKNTVAQMAVRRSMRRYKRNGITVVQGTIDHRPTAPDLEIQRQKVKDQITSLGVGTVMGSSAGAQEALRLALLMGIKGIGNQGFLTEGDHTQSHALDKAARNHQRFGSAVREFELCVAPQIAGDPNRDRFLTIGSSQDSEVPRALKSTPGVRHAEVEKPRGVLALANRFLDHGVSIYQGLRHPEVIKHILK